MAYKIFAEKEKLDSTSTDAAYTSKSLSAQLQEAETMGILSI